MGTDFCQLADVKGYLPGQAQTSANDTVLARLITAASDWIRTYLNRDISTGSYEDVLDGTGSARINVRQFPVQSIEAVTVDGQVVDPTVIVIQRGLLTRTDGGRFTRGQANVVIDYHAGLPTVPPAVAQACIELVAWRFNESKRAGLHSKSLQTGGEVESYQITDAPASVKTLLQNLRSVVPA